jgi:hypothetical protein
MARNRLKSKGRSEKGSFLSIPSALHDHPEFCNLSGSALKVLLGLLRQYRGSNNGDLSASHSQAVKWGVSSKTSLANALSDLQEYNFIIRTRQGYFTNPGGRCALYALAWKPIDECAGKDLEIYDTTTPRLKLSLQSNKKPGPKTIPG